jgi:ribosomal protein L17
MHKSYLLVSIPSVVADIPKERAYLSNHCTAIVENGVSETNVSVIKNIVAVIEKIVAVKKADVVEKRLAVNVSR